MRHVLISTHQQEDVTDGRFSLSLSGVSMLAIVKRILLEGMVKTSNLLKRYQITMSELCTLHLIMNEGVLELISVGSIHT